MYVVKKRFGRSETTVQEFLDEKNAEHFIVEKLREDERFKIKDAIYCLYEGADLHREFTQKDIPASTGSAAGAPISGGQGQGQGQVFNPSPLNMKLTPGGMQNNWKDVPKMDDDEK